MGTQTPTSSPVPFSTAYPPNYPPPNQTTHYQLSNQAVVKALVWCPIHSHRSTHPWPNTPSCLTNPTTHAHTHTHTHRLLSRPWHGAPSRATCWLQEVAQLIGALSSGIPTPA